MTETQVPALLGAFAVGIAVGVVFFGGLWLTVERLGSAPFPVVRLLTSLFLRFALALGAFYALARYGEALDVVAGAIGFTAVRLVLVARSVRRSREPETGA